MKIKAPVETPVELVPGPDTACFLVEGGSKPQQQQQKLITCHSHFYGCCDCFLTLQPSKPSPYLTDFLFSHISSLWPCHRREEEAHHRHLPPNEETSITTKLEAAAPRHHDNSMFRLTTKVVTSAVLTSIILPA